MPISDAPANAKLFESLVDSFANMLKWRAYFGPGTKSPYTLKRTTTPPFAYSCEPELKAWADVFKKRVKTAIREATPLIQ